MSRTDMNKLYTDQSQTFVALFFAWQGDALAVLVVNGRASFRCAGTWFRSFHIFEGTCEMNMDEE